MLIRIVILFFLIINFNLAAQTVFISDSGSVIFYSHAPIEDINATSTGINGILNTVTGDLAFMIPMRSFHFHKKLMEEHFNEKYLETEKYPQATFKGSFISIPDFNKQGVINVSAKGVIKIHGIEKEILENGTLDISENKIILSSEFYLKLKDFNITIPRIFFNNIADSVNVKMKTVYVPYKNK